MAIVGAEYYVPEERVLTVRKTLHFSPSDGLAAYDHRMGGLSFRADTYGRGHDGGAASAGELALLGSAREPLLTVRHRRPSLHHRWEGFLGGSPGTDRCRQVAGASRPPVATKGGSPSTDGRRHVVGAGGPPVTTKGDSSERQVVARPSGRWCTDRRTDAVRSLVVGAEEIRTERQTPSPSSGAAKRFLARERENRKIGRIGRGGYIRSEGSRKIGRTGRGRYIRGEGSWKIGRIGRDGYIRGEGSFLRL